MDRWINVQDHVFPPALLGRKMEMAQPFRQTHEYIDELMRWDTASTLACRNRTSLQAQMRRYRPTDEAPKAAIRITEQGAAGS